MTAFRAVERCLQDAIGVVCPAAQLVVVDQFRTVLDLQAGAAGPDTVFDLASLTKPLSTATLIMKRVESGHWSLDREARPGVMVRHLLEHASGLPAWKLLTPPPGTADPRAWVVDKILHEPLETPPGAVARYSDLGFMLLGALLEKDAGRSLAELFAEEIARPLSVETTYSPSDTARCVPTEGGLVGIVHDENARTMGGVAGHAGLFSTARDVSRIVSSLVETFHDRASAHPRLVRPETMRAFWTPSSVPGSTWCLGWDRPSLVNSSAGTRWPRDGVGHLGFTGTSIWIDPTRARWVVLLTNRVNPTRENQRIKELRPALHDLIVAALDD